MFPKGTKKKPLLLCTNYATIFPWPHYFHSMILAQLTSDQVEGEHGTKQSLVHRDHRFFSQRQGEGVDKTIGTKRRPSQSLDRIDTRKKKSLMRR